MANQQQEVNLRVALETANEHLAKGNVEQARQAYSEIISIIPDNIELLNMFASILVKTGHIEQAIINLNKSLTIEPEQSGAHCALANIHLSQERPDEANKHFHFALDINPNNHNAHRGLATLALPGEGYQKILRHFHDWLHPDTYIEIGVASGQSLSQARPPTQCLGIDPDPQVSYQCQASSKIYKMTSDHFFAEYNLADEIGRPSFDMAFIDGLHLFEAALKDFINLERYASANSIILLHDCLPLNKLTASRDHVTTFWSGDAWKVIPCLKEYRPDLEIFTIATIPTGLGAVTNLDSQSTILDDNIDQIIDKYRAMDYEYLNRDKHSQLNVVANDWQAIQENLESTWHRAQQK